jgi:Ser/Thr protein kinase RdoA (MazF antagonist)
MVILTKLRKSEFGKILCSYDIGDYVSSRHLDWALSNTVYKVRTTKGNYILKIFEKSSPAAINCQMKIMDFLAKNKIPVAQITGLKNRKKLLIRNSKRIIIQEFIEGKSQETYNKELLADIAGNFGRMSRCLQKLKMADKSGWKHNPFAPYGPLNASGFDFNFHASKLADGLKTLRKAKLRKSMTHGDVRGVNLLAKNDKLQAVLDFDDFHRDYIAYEIAIFLIDPFITNKHFNKKLAKIFFKEYQKHLKLNNEEKKAIYYFVKHRLLGIIAWSMEKRKLHKDQEEKLSGNIDKMTSKFLFFDKMAAEEFASLLD